MAFGMIGERLEGNAQIWSGNRYILCLIHVLVSVLHELLFGTDPEYFSQKGIELIKEQDKFLVVFSEKHLSFDMEHL